MIARTALMSLTLAVGAITFLASTRAADEATPSTRPIVMSTLATTRPLDLPGLHNVVEYADGIYSGAVPEGRLGFETLKSIGIRTILTVDGAAPDVETAKREGLRYVHLPIGYNGFDEKRELEIARVLRDLPGPIYVHCHHGKHRSASATAAAMVVLGKMTPDEAVARMKVSGTAPNYTGLYACARDAKLATAQQLDAASNLFPESSKPTGMVDAMVEVDEAADNLKLIEKAGWAVPTDHPDLVPAAEAGRLADLLRNSQESHEVKAKPAAFATSMQKSADDSAALEAMLVAGNVPAAKLSTQFKGVMQSCKDCHGTFRD